MRKLFIALLSACLGVPAFASNFTTVMATNIAYATAHGLPAPGAAS
jgi:hypothetical protein